MLLESQSKSAAVILYSCFFVGCRFGGYEIEPTFSKTIVRDSVGFLITATNLTNDIQNQFILKTILVLLFAMGLKFSRVFGSFPDG